MSELSTAVKQLLLDHGLLCVKEPEQFCAYLDQMTTDLSKEKNIIRRVLIPNMEICERIYALLSRGYSKELSDFKSFLQDEYGLNSMWIETVCEAFGFVETFSERSDDLDNNMDEPENEPRTEYNDGNDQSAAFQAEPENGIVKIKEAPELPKNNKWVYLFLEGNEFSRELLGNKGIRLVKMTKLGLPVPPGFIITTEACSRFYEDGRKINDEIHQQVMNNISKLEEYTGKGFGSKDNPLVVSVRTGAKAAFPGINHTVLNLGLNDDIVENIAQNSGNPHWAWDSYRTFLQTYGELVGIAPKYYQELTEKMIRSCYVNSVNELTAEDLKRLSYQFKDLYQNLIGDEMPSDPRIQLFEAIRASFDLWDNPRANVYRKENDLPFSWGLAVTVQLMVFGNMGDDCGSGIVFTRDSTTGQRGLLGEFMPHAQGNELISSTRIPITLSEMAEKFPVAYQSLEHYSSLLESDDRNILDIEFTVEHGKLFFLSSKYGRRTARAAFRIASDMVDEGLITEEEAVRKVTAKDLKAMLNPHFFADELRHAVIIGKGLAASPGAVCCPIAFFDDILAGRPRVNVLGKKSSGVILVKNVLTEEDASIISSFCGNVLLGIPVKGILTTSGGMTSPAAVCARQKWIPCVTDCTDLIIDEKTHCIHTNRVTIYANSKISLDGNSGIVYSTEMNVDEDPKPDGYVSRIMGFAEKYGLVIE